MPYIAINKPEELEGRASYSSQKGALLAHSTYIDKEKMEIRQSEVTLSIEGTKRLNYLVDSKIKEVREAARELRRVRQLAIKGNEKLRDLTKTQAELKIALRNEKPYVTNNPFGKGYIAQTLYSISTWFNATFLNNENAKTQLKAMREYDENYSQLAAVEGVMPAVEYNRKSEIAESKALEKELENTVNAIANKSPKKLTLEEKILLANLESVTAGADEYVSRDIILKAAVKEALKAKPDYDEIKKLLNTKGLELPPLSDDAKKLTSEQQISYQLALIIGVHDADNGNILLEKAGLETLTPTETKRLNPYEPGTLFANNAASFNARAESRLNTTLAKTEVPEAIGNSNIEINENYIEPVAPRRKNTGADLIVSEEAKAAAGEKYATPRNIKTAEKLASDRGTLKTATEHFMGLVEFLRDNKPTKSSIIATDIYSKGPDKQPESFNKPVVQEHIENGNNNLNKNPQAVSKLVK